MADHTKFSELVHGKDFADKSDLFANELKKIEEKYIDFFKSRPAKLSKQNHDKITNHVGTNYDGVTITLLYTSKELRENIKNDVDSLFNQIWETK